MSGMGDLIFEALRASMSEPGCGYIDFTWRSGDPDGHPRGAAAAREYAEDIAAHMTDSLDSAWAEAEAALPEGWHLDRINRNGPKDWTAYASEAPYLGLEMGAENTPAAALRALAAKLRERAG